MKNLIKNIELYRLIAENMQTENAMFACMKLMRGIETALKNHEPLTAEKWLNLLVQAYNKGADFADGVSISIAKLDVVNSIIRMSKLNGYDVPNIPHTRTMFFAAGVNRKHPTPAITDKQLVMNWGTCTGSINLKKTAKVAVAVNEEEEFYNNIYNETEPGTFKAAVIKLTDEDDCYIQRADELIEEELPDNEFVTGYIYLKLFYGSVNTPFARANGKGSMARIGEHVSLLDGTVCVRVE